MTLEPLRLYSAAPDTRSERALRYRLPTTVSASLLVHAAVFAALWVAMQRMPHNTALPLPPRYALRVIDALPLPHQPLQYTAASAASAGSAHAAAASTAGQASASPEVARLPLVASNTNPTTAAAPAPVLIQPDLPTIPVLHVPPVPSVVLWSAEKTPTPHIIPPPPQPPPASLRPPSIAPPLREPRIADITISSTAFTSTPRLPAPSTTAPVVRGAPPVPVQSLPQTALAPSRPPTPARILSLSDLHMPGGAIALPPVNSAGAARISVAPSPASTSSGSEGDATAAVALPGSGTHAAANAHGSGNGQGTNPGVNGQAGHGAGQSQLASNGAGTGAHPGSGAGDGSGQGGAGGPGGNGTGPAAGSGSGEAAAGAGLLNVTHLLRPHDGQFGFVVLGSNSRDTYPDLPDVWNGRLMYSVYLPMAQGKSWILQYSLPASASTSAAQGRPDAPWPYDMLRPNRSASDPGASDPIMIHGIVTSAGKFDQLAVVFPSELPEAASLLHALRQWIFRPSRQNGQPVAVEVLLIVPAMVE